jgi:hypothetical protein
VATTHALVGHMTFTCILMWWSNTALRTHVTKAIKVPRGIAVFELREQNKIDEFGYNQLKGWQMLVFSLYKFLLTYRMHAHI